MKPVTKWERWVEPDDGRPPYWAHNHLEDGHAASERPSPMNDRSGREYKRQRDSWAKATWRRSFGHLTDDLVYVAAE